MPVYQDRCLFGRDISGNTELRDLRDYQTYAGDPHIHVYQEGLRVGNQTRRRAQILHQDSYGGLPLQGQTFVSTE